MLFVKFYFYFSLINFRFKIIKHLDVMKIVVLMTLLVLGTTRGQDDGPRGKVTCEDGIEAKEMSDSFCCFENGLKYCCKKDAPLICFTERMDADGNEGRLLPPPGAPAEEEECTAVKVHRTAMSTMRVLNDKLLRLATLTLSQSEGCDKDMEMSIRWSGLDPGKDYEILIGDNPACGAKNDDARVIARMEVTARSGNVQVPSEVKSLRDIKGKQLSLRFVDEEGATFACGPLTVLGL